MIRADLFNIANSGINASNQLLNTTSNNIANGSMTVNQKRSHWHWTSSICHDLQAINCRVV